MKAYFQRLMQHADWANTRILELLRASTIPDQHAVRLFSHVLTTEQIYYARMTRKDPWPQDFWPGLSLGDCAMLASENRLRYGIFFEKLADDEIEGAVQYRNSKGAVFSTPLKDLLTHLALHGAYHRGQIAQAIRLAGGEPVNTDFITFVRGGS